MTVSRLPQFCELVEPDMPHKGQRPRCTRRREARGGGITRAKPREAGNGRGDGPRNIRNTWKVSGLSIEMPGTDHPPRRSARKPQRKWPQKTTKSPKRSDWPCREAGRGVTCQVSLPGDDALARPGLSVISVLFAVNSTPSPRIRVRFSCVSCISWFPARGSCRPGALTRRYANMLAICGSFPIRAHPVIRG